MPWIRVDLSSGRTEDQKAKAAEAITKALVEHCNCKPENWASGGVLLSKR
jgi:4-oxalocrotonate tautomerase